MTDTKYITEENYPAFKSAYDKAVAEGREVFVFEMHQVLTAWAKYVVEYIETKEHVA